MLNRIFSRFFAPFTPSVTCWACRARAPIRSSTDFSTKISQKNSGSSRNGGRIRSKRSSGFCFPDCWVRTFRRRSSFNRSSSSTSWTCRTTTWWAMRSKWRKLRSEQKWQFLLWNVTWFVSWNETVQKGEIWKKWLLCENILSKIWFVEILHLHREWMKWWIFWTFKFQ